MARRLCEPTVVERNYMAAVEELKDYLQNGLVADVFQMESAYMLHRAIGDHSDEFVPGGFGELFGTIQAALELDAALAVARVYDTPSSRYPTRCLRSAVYLLEECGLEENGIIEEYNTVLCLNRAAAPDYVIAAVSEGLGAFAGAYARWFGARLDDPGVNEHVERLRYLRDKRIAHNEAAEPRGPTWDSLHELTELAKEFIGVVGWAFFSTVYEHDGRYILSEDAQRPSRAFRRLVRYLPQKENAP